MYSISEFAGLLVKQAREEKQWDQQYLADELDIDSGPCPRMRTAMPAVRIFLFLPSSSVFEKWFYQIFQKRRVKNVL